MICFGGPMSTGALPTAGQFPAQYYWMCARPGNIAGGIFPASKNLPLEDLGMAEKMIAAQDTPVFLYCYSGSRSGRAAGLLRRMGYTNVQNIGGIAAWDGKAEQ